MWLSKNRRIILVVIILLLGLFLRLHNYDKYPQRGATSDEYTYSFLGVSLITERLPMSWSYFSYKYGHDLTIDKLYFPIVYPYFDHVPLNGIVVGAWAVLFGENSFEKIQLSTIRLVPILLSTFSSWLVFLLGRKLFDFKTGIWAMLIFSTVTIFVIQSRVVLAENLLTPLFLGVLYLYLQFKKQMTDRKVMLLGILGGLALLTKELGVAVFFTLLYLFITDQVPRRKIIILSLSFFIVGMLYVLYGAYYDWDGFIHIVTTQASRVIGPQTLRLLLTKPILINKVYYDGWYFLGFIGFFLSFLDFRKYKMVLVPAFIYFMLLIFSLSREGEMGWYMLPLFPFMSILIAEQLRESIHQKGWVIFLFLIFVGLSQVEHIYEANFGLTATQFRLALFFLFGPLIGSLLLGKQVWFEKLSIGMFYLLVFGNIFLTYFYTHPG